MWFIKIIKVAIDFDGTLCKTNDLICDLINYKYNIKYTYKDIISWDFWLDNNLKDKFWEVFDLFDKTNLRMAMDVYDKSLLYYFKKIYNTSHKKDALYSIDIVTSNNNENNDIIKKWCEYLLDTDLEKENIKCIGRDSNKLEYDYDIYIDDNPTMANDIINYPQKKMILMNAVWNKNIKETNQVKRANNWKEVYNLLISFLTNVDKDCKKGYEDGYKK